MNPIHIGERIKTARIKAGFHRNRLAAQMGMSTSVLQQYESGASFPGYWALHELARALGVTLNYLFGVE